MQLNPNDYHPGVVNRATNHPNRSVRALYQARFGTGGGVGQRLSSRGNVGTVGGEDYGANVRSLLQRQLEDTERIREQQLADRDAALGLLQGQHGRRSPDYETVVEGLKADPSDTPFGRELRSSLTDTLQNPDVYTEQQIEDYKTRSFDQISRSVDDAMRDANVNTAQRGIGQSGINDRLRQELTLEGGASAVQAAGEIEFAAAEARAANLQFAQQMGVQYESAMSQERGRRLAALANYIDSNEARDLEIVTGMAEILANTEYATPDYAGFAAVEAELFQAAQSALLQRENLALLEQQIAANREVGLASVEADQAIAQANFEYQQQLQALNDQINGFAQQLAEEEDTP